MRSTAARRIASGRRAPAGAPRHGTGDGSVRLDCGDSGQRRWSGRGWECLARCGERLSCGCPPLAAAGNFLTGAARGRLRCSGPGNSPCLSRRGCGRVRRGDQHGAHAAAHDGFRTPFGCGKPSVKADSPVRAAASPGQEAIESGPSRQHEGDGSDDPCERYKNLCPEHAFPSARHGRDASGAELRRDRDPGRVLMVAGRAAAARTSRAA